MSLEGRGVAVIRRIATSRRRSLGVAAWVAGLIVLAGCASPAVVEDRLEADGSVATDFTVDDQQILLSARFDSKLAASDTFMVEWIFPDGSVYLRKPVRRSAESAYRVDTGIAVRGKTPARHPGIWHVELRQDGKRLVSRAFEIREPPRTAQAHAAEFASLDYCGPWHWNDAVISARRPPGAVSARPGAWIGGEVLKAAGATYSGAVLLTGCAPG